jgi:hypothetical protein
MKNVLKAIALASLAVLASIAFAPLLMIGSAAVALVASFFGLVAAVIAIPAGVSGRSVELNLDGWWPVFRITCGLVCTCGECSHYQA